MGTRDSSELWNQLDKGILHSLDKWLDGKTYNVKLDHWITSGSSSIPLAVIRRSKPRNDKVILKFLNDSKHARRWDEATQNCPKEFEDHVIQLKDPSMLGDSGLWIGILEIGRGDISKCRPLTELTRPSGGTDLTKACQVIIDSIIGKWNPHPLDDPVREVPASEYFSYTFERNRAEEGGTLYRTLDAHSIDKTAKLIQSDFWPDGELPNPLIFTENLRKPTLHGWYGRAHQDLHAGNILLSINPFDPNSYKLIDLEYFSSTAPLTRDPMILLLSIAKNWLKGIGAEPESYHRLIRVIVDGIPDNSFSSAFHQVSHTIHNTGYRWATEQGEGDEWTAQSLLSLAACGLRYASRKHEDMKDADAVRAWYFALAAFAVRRYLEKTDQWAEFKKGAASRPVTPTPEFGDSVAGSTKDDGENEAPAESDHHEARIIDFPPIREPNPWKDLAKELRALDLGSTDWRILSAKTGRLRMLLPLQIRACTSSDDWLKSLLSDLEGALKTATSPYSSSPDLHSALNEIKRITAWILDLIAE